MVMQDPGEVGSAHTNLDSSIDAVHTYLGQFIDHDITARTDRETNVSEIGGFDGDPANIEPANPEDVVRQLKNGRRPQLDLDSVFGDGPAFASEVLGDQYRYSKEADGMYDRRSLKMKLNTSGGGIDLYREDGRAIIADARNDENLMISQLHAAFIAAYNNIADSLGPSTSSFEREGRYSRARKLLRWAYQYIVVNDYLKQVCDVNTLFDTLENGPYFFMTDGGIYMPLEFSVAAFRFGHSMIRPFYRINDTLEEERIMNLLGETFHNNLFQNDELRPQNNVDWTNFVGPTAQKARKIDWRIARGLFELNAIESSIPAGRMLARLSQRNLLRGYSLSLPTGQAVAKAMGIYPLTEEEVLADIGEPNRAIIAAAGLGRTTPLWFYILKEADIQNGGERLGVVGSTLVAETLVGLVKCDPNSYLNNQHAAEVHSDGIEVAPGTRIATIADLLDFAVGLS